MTRTDPPGTARGFAHHAAGQELLSASVAEAHSTAYSWLRHHAATRPDAPAVAQWGDRARSPWLTFSAACRIVDEFARGLRALGVRPGDRVVLALPNGTPFFCAVVGCIAAGAVAVPAPVPGVARSGAFGERIKGLVSDCAPALLVTDPEQAELIPGIVGGQWSAVSCQAVAVAGAGSSRPVPPEVLSPVALLQYTSGSTGKPRGMVVTHDALRANCAQAAQAYTERPEDVGVTWAPVHHDLGLNTGVMRPLFSGYPSVLLRPEDFVRRPLTWLEAIHACGGTMSSGPNFAYDLCVRKIAPEQVSKLDLSTWRIARNAGEVVRADTVDRFVARFAAAGFRPEAVCTGYGLAEATLSVTTCTPEVRPLRLQVGQSGIRGGVVTVANDPPRPDVPVQSLLSSGVPLAGTSVRAGDGGGRVGRIKIRGPQVAAETWGGHRCAPDGTDYWYDTGDLGFIYDGHLFVLGRADDTVVYHGRNFYLADVVAVCSEIAGLRPGRAVPFALRDEQKAADKVCVVAELRPGTEPDADVLTRLTGEIRRRLASALELYPARVEFVAAGTLPVTTSGKLRASEVRRRFEEGRLPVL